jgi:hypothetical protein
MWLENRHPVEVGVELVGASRALARDIQAVDNLTGGLGWIPDQHRGFDALDSHLVAELRVGGVYSRLRRTLRGHWLAQLVDLCEADDALAAGNFGRATELVERVSSDRLPVPWYFLAARLALHRGDTDYALIAASLVAAFCPHGRQAYALIGDILLRDGRMAEAVTVLARAADLPEVDVLAIMTRSMLPMRICERFSRQCLQEDKTIMRQLGRIQRFVQRGVLLYGWKEVVRKLYR